MKFNKLIVLSLFIVACGGNQESTENTESETASTEMTENSEDVASEGEWISIFHEEDFDGWRGYGRNDIPGVWSVEDQTIKISAPVEGEENDNGDIIYDQKLKNFEFSFEWKISEGGNSGIFYLAREIDGQPIYRSAPEFQLLDNVNHPDAKLGKDQNRQAGSLYDLIPAVPQNANPFDEWNSGKIIVVDGKVTHEQNGEKVVEYELWTPEWESMIEDSKFNGWTEMIQAGGEEHEGYIGLQDHGNDVWFRNLKIKVLP